MAQEMRGIYGEGRLYALLFTQNKALPQEVSGEIYHYTSPHNIKSILFRDNGAGERGITLWASRYDCLNDASEGTIADKVYKEALLHMYQNGEISECLYTLCSKAKAYTKGYFSYYDEKERSNKSWTSKAERFVVSFSKNPDSLAMWKYYSKGNEYEGVNLGFDIEKIWNSLRKNGIDDADIDIVPVIYDKNKQIEIIRNAILNLRVIYDEDEISDVSSRRSEITNRASSLLTEWKLAFKSKFFEHEEEVRIIINISKEKPNEEYGLPVEYRYSNGYWIPYVELFFDIETLNQITLGPTGLVGKQKMTQTEIVVDMLRSKGYMLDKIEWSQIPVRY